MQTKKRHQSVLIGQDTLFKADPQNSPKQIRGLPANPMTHFDSLVNGITSDSHTQHQRVANLESFRKSMATYVEALQKSHHVLQAEVFDLEDVLAKKDKELYELR